MSWRKKREARFERWLAPPGVEFVSKEAAELYRARVSRIRGASFLSRSIPREFRTGMMSLSPAHSQGRDFSSPEARSPHFDLRPAMRAARSRESSSPPPGAAVSGEGDYSASASASAFPARPSSPKKGSSSSGGGSSPEVSRAAIYRLNPSEKPLP